METPLQRALRQIQYDFDRGKHSSFIMICDAETYSQLKLRGYTVLDLNTGLTEIRP